ncbi:hypothetical protein HDU76_000463 [Blyttiomyces sp. JEL0837]|nr:hypothetical protein HDU76_000463 [Blyttiomyces sp. JEL0837]
MGPFNLLVEGDIIQMAFGDKSPCDAEFCGVAAQYVNGKIIIRKGEILKPSAFGAQIHPKILEESRMNSGQFYFRLLESPLVTTLESALTYRRPETVILKQLQILLETLTSRVIWIVLGVCFVINILRYAILATSTEKKRDFAIELLFNAPFFALVPLLPLSLPALCLISRSYGNAQIVCLFDLLQNSKKEFKDEANIDEFDLAPPPTKDVATDWASVWKYFLDQLIRVDVSFLARTTGLVESLASTTVICFIDREGSLSMPYPSIDSLFFLEPGGDGVVLDVNEEPRSSNGVSFEDKDWFKYLPNLKPLGLNFFLSASCTYGKRKRENHRKSNYFNIDGRAKPARQSQSDYHFEIPSVNSQIYLDKDSGIHQILTDGNVDMILQYSADFWNGQTLELFNDMAEKKIYEFYQNAVFNDMQVIAYSYRPIPNIPQWDVKAAYIEDKSEPYVFDFMGDSGYLELTPMQKLYRKKEYVISPIDLPEYVRTDDQETLKELFKGQTFLGMASLYYQPKPNVIDFIEDLGLAGIRFVYFSAAPERESKAYAERLGLEIDWNSCILLSSSDGTGNDYLELHDLKARLPRGVENIRSHIENVDDVPLHVSLFAECSPMSTREMVRIFQEYGEVADIAVAVDPFPALKNRSPTQGPLMPLVLGAGFASSPCALKFHFDTSPFCLTQLIREARTLAENGRQCGTSFANDYSQVLDSLQSG